MWVESELGKGTTLHFTARFRLGHHNETEALSFNVEDLSNLRVLIADDNAISRLVLREMTSAWGLKPTEVADGEKAISELERAHKAGQPYQLLLLDRQMPESDGVEVFRRIKENPVYSDLEIIMLISSGIKGDAEPCKKVGVRRYLVKPVKQSELLEGIMSAMGHPIVKKGSVSSLQSMESASKRLKILLAEDNVINQKLALRILEKWGHQVTVVPNGLEALEALTRGRFDLVLMDIQMPVMGGLEATGCIRDSERMDGGHIPIVAMTAYAMKGDREKCLAVGMDDYVAKPIKADELFAVIEALGSGVA